MEGDVLDDLLHLGEPLALLRTLAVALAAASADSKRASTTNRPSSVTSLGHAEESLGAGPELLLPPIDSRSIASTSVTLPLITWMNMWLSCSQLAAWLALATGTPKARHQMSTVHPAPGSVPDGTS